MVNQLISKRLGGIEEYYFSKKLREIAGLKAQGVSVFNLGIGSPDIKPPKEVEEALINGLSDSNYHQYQPYKGIPELRNAFASWYLQHFSVALNSETEILPLIGSKEGIMHISMAFIDPGDHVLVPNPGYPSYYSASMVAGADLVHYALSEDNHYYPDFDALEAEDLSKVKIMWVNYPHMPTGADGNEKLFNNLLEFSRKHNIVIVNDNPYAFILTSERHSILKNRNEDDLVLELNSLSKAHNMAGWRVGALAGNRDLVQAVLTFKSNMDSGQFRPIMQAAIAALKLPATWYEALNKEYGKRRELVFKIAKKLNCTFDPTQVGMFVWCAIPSNWDHAEKFADHLLCKYRIFIPPGTVFGSEGKKYIRFSLCSDTTIWMEVLRRIEE
ncbi:MAG: aminotransferase class I/II-fold pyridoxal phosphate-dependent enzyme [Bacteroidota bacterium]